VSLRRRCLKSVYAKLANVESDTSAALVRHTTDRLGPVIGRMNGALRPPLKGFRTKILDGNHVERTQRRIKLLQDVAAGPLRGQTLVVLDSALGLAIEVVCCEHGHAEEGSLFADVLALVRNRDLWIRTTGRISRDHWLCGGLTDNDHGFGCRVLLMDQARCSVTLSLPSHFSLFTRSSSA